MSRRRRGTVRVARADLVYSFSNCCFWKALGVVVAEED